MEFKRPKSYKPSFGQPSPSRDEILKSELGFDGEDPDTCSSGTSDEEPEVDQLSNSITAVQIQSLRVEIQQKDKQREELLLKLKTLSDKTATYKARLAKSEQSKKCQLKIMKKTHETLTEQKDRVIADLKEMILDMEKQPTGQEQNESKKARGTKGSSSSGLSGLHQLVDTINKLHKEKAKYTETLLTCQSELEEVKNEAKDNAARYRNEILEFQSEIKRLQSNSKQDRDDKKENLSINSSSNVSRLEDDNKTLRREKKELELEFWQTQESLRDEIRRLEEDVKAANKKTRDAESKYINLAATPPKVQVKTVSVVSENMRKRLDELIDKNRDLETLLKQTKVEHNSTVSGLEKELSLMKSNCKNLQIENEKLLLENKTFSEVAEQNSKLQSLLKRTEHVLEDKTNKLEKLETKLNVERQANQRELENILKEKAAEIEEAKLEAEKNTSGIQKLYESLKANCSNLFKEARRLRNDYKELKTALLQFSTTIGHTCRGIYKQVIQEIEGIDEKEKELLERYVKEMKLRKKLHNELVELKGNIRVYCRVRPLIGEDGEGKQAENVISFDKNDDGVVLVNNKGTTKKFELERVFPPISTQEQVFSQVKNLVISCLDGYNVCIFAYGQTGSGKTYTMEGPADNPGVNQRALRLLFDLIQERSKGRVEDWNYSVSVSVLEVYNENIRDLLSAELEQKLEIKLGKHGHHVPGLTEVKVHNIDHVNELFALGKQNRATATTNMNEHSSRSHAIFRVKVVGSHNTTGSVVTGKLNLVDLAGSEKLEKSGSEGLRMKEAQNINKSLSSLGDVIHALKNKHPHIPYRNSKLTFLLQDSLGGDSKTLMVVQISPVIKNVRESICSLTFAQRVRQVELGQATRNMESAEAFLTTDKVKESEATPNRGPRRR